MKKGNNKQILVIIGLMLGILISAMDNTIISTAMGTIISRLGGMDKFIWVTSAYMIASVAGMPIYGKLSDMYGRKMYFLFGLSLFMVGSILCGTAQSMTQLIIYRAIQGLGGGAIMPIAFTIVFDIIPVNQRGKISGLFGATFGLSSIFGPLIGACLTDYLDWRWIFYINIPLGLTSLILLYKFYKESPNHTKQKIDWLGAILLVSSVLCLMFALELGGKDYAWLSPQILFLLTAFTVLLTVFLIVEAKVSDPIISLKMFKKKLFAASQGVGFFYGSVFILATIYIPIFVQGVFKGSATNAGLILIPMTVASVVGSQIGGLLSNKISYRNIMFGSIAFFMSGIYLLSTISVDTSRWFVTLFMIITGLGVGVSFSVLTISSIHGMDFNQRGSANSSLSFFRMIGMTLGVTIFGTIQNNIMQSRFTNDISGFSSHNNKIDARALLQPEVRAHIPHVVLGKMTGILADSIASIFMLSLVSLTIAFIFIIIMGKSRLEVVKFQQ